MNIHGSCSAGSFGLDLIITFIIHGEDESSDCSLNLKLLASDSDETRFSLLLYNGFDCLICIFPWVCSGEKIPTMSILPI